MTWDEVTDSSYQKQTSLWLLWKQSQEENQPYKQLVTNNKQTNLNKQTTTVGHCQSTAVTVAVQIYAARQRVSLAKVKWINSDHALVA